MARADYREQDDPCGFCDPWRFLIAFVIVNLVAFAVDASLAGGWWCQWVLVVIAIPLAVVAWRNAGRYRHERS